MVVDDLSDCALRTEIKRFERLADGLSYRRYCRRVLQGRLDILVAYGGVIPERANLAELSCVLAVSGRRELPAVSLGIPLASLSNSRPRSRPCDQTTGRVRDRRHPACRTRTPPAESDFRIEGWPGPVLGNVT